VKEAIGAIESGLFSPDDPGRFRGLADSLRHADPYMVAADFAAYRAASGGRGAMAGSRGMGPRQCDQHRPDGMVFRRPHDRRICRGHLACAAEHRLILSGDTAALLARHQPAGRATMVKTTARNSVASALISGVTPMRTLE